MVFPERRQPKQSLKFKKRSKVDIYKNTNSTIKIKSNNGGINSPTLFLQFTIEISNVIVLPRETVVSAITFWKQ